VSETNEHSRHDPISESEDEAIDRDSMGKDKRRQVIGETYGPTVRKQVTVYGIFFAVVIALAIGFLTVVDSIDNREMPLEDTAPWAAEEVELRSPGNIDFPLSSSANQGGFPGQ